MAEPAILIALRMNGFVFFPQQEQRHAFAFELLVHGGPVGDQATAGRFPWPGGKQALLQDPLVELCYQRPGEPGHGYAP